MKKGIFTFALLFLIGDLFAQTTLVSTNMGLDALIGTSTIGRVRTNPQASTLNIAANGNWDLTNLTYDSSFSFVRFPSPVSGFSFADTLQREFFNKFSFSGISVNLAVIQDVAEWRQAIDPQSYRFPKASGISDTILFPTQVAVYSAPHYELEFPLNYHDSYRSDYSYITAFNVSDSEAGIYRASGSMFSTVTETDSVLGWGKMKINRMDSVNGGLKPSALVNVLQVRVRNIQIDTYYISTPNLYDSLGFSNTVTVDTTVDSLHPPLVDSSAIVDTIPNISTIIVVNGNDTTVTYDTTYSYDTTGYMHDTTYLSYTYTTTKRYNTHDTTSTNMVLFYRAGSITPLARVLYTDATFSTIKHVYINTDLSEFPEGIETVPDQYAISVYPNPVTDGKTYIDIADPGTGNWSYELVNIMGQSLVTHTIPTNGSSVHQQANLPTNLPRGIYYLRVNNNGKQTFVKALNIAN